MDKYRVSALILYLIITSTVTYAILLKLPSTKIRSQVIRIPGAHELGINLAFFIIAIILITTIFSILVRKGGLRILSAIFLLTLLYLSFYSLLFICSISGAEVWKLPFTISIAVLWTLLIAFRRHIVSYYIHEVLLLITGILTGTMMAVMFPEILSILVLLLLSVYDIISVRMGFIKMLMDKVAPEPIEENEEKPREFSLANPVLLATAYIGLASLGIGDIICYSMMMTLYGIAFNPMCSFIAFITINSGIVLLYMLMKKFKLRYAPGLPIPTILSLTVYGILKLYYP